MISPNNQGASFHDPGKEDERKLIETLRKEAQEVKDCFTRFSFAALGIATGVFGLIASQMKDHEWVAFAAVPVIVMLVVVARIGTYKYATSNRNFGYELHLGRVRASGPPQAVVYEEAMLAWRIVQATIFKSLHSWWGMKRGRVAWCVMPQHHIGSLKQDARYAAGSYLRNMLVMLLVVTGLAVIPLILLAFRKPADDLQSWGCISLVACVPYTLYYFWRIFRDCSMLEGGMKSIQGCAIMWDAVEQAHLCAAKGTKAGSTDYMKKLADETSAICASIKDKCPGNVKGLTSTTPTPCATCLMFVQRAEPTRL
jgi:hypothetical protein